MADEQKPTVEPTEVQIDELDEKDLEDASGGLAELEDTTNNGCNCGCALD